MAERKDLDPVVRIQAAAMTPMIEGVRLDGIIKLLSKYEQVALGLNTSIDNILIASATSLSSLRWSFPDTEMGDAMYLQAGTTKMQVTGKVIEKLLNSGAI